MNDGRQSNGFYTCVFPYSYSISIGVTWWCSLGASTASLIFCLKNNVRSATWKWSTMCHTNGCNLMHATYCWNARYDFHSASRADHQSHIAIRTGDNGWTHRCDGTFTCGHIIICGRRLSEVIWIRWNSKIIHAAVEQNAGAWSNQTSTVIIVNRGGHRNSIAIRGHHRHMRCSIFGFIAKFSTVMLKRLICFGVVDLLANILCVLGRRQISHQLEMMNRAGVRFMPALWVCLKYICLPGQRWRSLDRRAVYVCQMLQTFNNKQKFNSLCFIRNAKPWI